MSRALKNLQRNFELYWYLAQNFRINEKTIGFQGRHKDTLWITFKYSGNGFQVDDVCDHGYT